MKKRFIFLMILSGFVPCIESGKRTYSEQALRMCAVCSESVTKRDLRLPCNHPICTNCLNLWQKKKAMCLQCQQDKQRLMKSRQHVWAYRGLGILFGLAALGAWRGFYFVDTYLGIRSPKG